MITNIETIDITNKKIQKAYLEWIDGVDGWNVAGTLTFPESIEDLSPTVQRHRIEEANHLYWNILDKKVYGKAVERYGKRLPRFCFIQHLGRNGHIHFLSKAPEKRMSPEMATLVMKSAWEDELPYSGIAEVVPLTDAHRWASYISREIRWENVDSLDVVATHTQG